ncbi:MAG: hypothetical protein ACK4RK_05500 [Gemmataceae bacterium]
MSRVIHRPRETIRQGKSLQPSRWHGQGLLCNVGQEVPCWFVQINPLPSPHKNRKTRISARTSNRHTSGKIVKAHMPGKPNIETSIGKSVIHH